MKDLLQNRKFITVDTVTANSDHFNFTICSYNILAQYQLKNNLYLYKHCDPTILEWPVRWNNIRNDLERLNCDIYCLQEVQCDHYSRDINPAMEKMGYRGFLSEKSGPKQDGCALFVKLAKFNWDLSTFETVNFHYPGIRSLSSNNVGQVALLCPAAGSLVSTRICIANTHLFFNPNRGDVKLGELILMLAKIDSMSTSGRSNDRQEASFYWPIVFCGDFNSEPGSKIHQFLVDGHLDLRDLIASDISGQSKRSFWGSKSNVSLSADDLPPRGLGISDRMIVEDTTTAATSSGSGGAMVGTGRLSHALRLRSSIVDDGRDPSSTMVTASTNVDQCCAVDLILYRDISTTTTTTNGGTPPPPRPYLQLIDHLDLVTPDQLASIGGIPNDRHGSDHVPLVATFALHLPSAPPSSSS